MIILTATADALRVVTGAAADIESYVSFIEVDSATPPVVQDVGQVSTADITSAATTNILTCTTSARKRRVMYASLHNNSSTACGVVVELFNGTTARNLIDATLLQNESLVYNGSTWLHYDSNGAIYPSVGNAATQAEMEGGTANNKYVTPEGVNWHPGVCKCWVKCGVTANILASWNVTSLVDNGTGDVTVTIGIDFSTVDYAALVSVEMTATTYGVANTREAHIRSGGLTVGTTRFDCVDNTATTSLIKDPTTWHIAMFGDQA